MLRSHALQPLSREHHSALKLALACERAALSVNETEVKLACQRALRFHADELETHFHTEETTLLPLLNGLPEQTLAERMLAEHRQLRALRVDLEACRANALMDYGKFLAAHVRFEERTLFPELESQLQPPHPET